LILTAITKTVAALLDRFGLLDFLFQRFEIGVFVFLKGHPLALVIVEFGLVHHGDAMLHRANFLANAATTAHLEIGIVRTVRGDIERSIRAVEPAKSALGASSEVNDGPQSARRILLEEFVASWAEAAKFLGDGVGIGAALRLALDGNAGAHVAPTGEVELEEFFRIALAGFHIDGGEAVEGSVSRSHFDRALQLFGDEFLDRGQAEEFGQGLGDGAEDAQSVWSSL